MIENKIHDQLSRRERQLMDLIYQLGHASAKDLQDQHQDKLSNSSIRTFLSIMVDKGLLKKKKEGKLTIAYSFWAPVISDNVQLQSFQLGAMLVWTCGHSTHIMHNTRIAT